MRRARARREQGPGGRAKCAVRALAGGGQEVVAEEQQRRLHESLQAMATTAGPWPLLPALAGFAAPRGQDSALVGRPQLVQAAEGLAVDDDLRERVQAGDAGKLGLKLRMLAEVDLFEHHAPLHEQRPRVDAERARVRGEEDDVAGHLGKYAPDP